MIFPTTVLCPHEKISSWRAGHSLSSPQLCSQRQEEPGVWQARPSLMNEWIPCAIGSLWNSGFGDAFPLPAAWPGVMACECWGAESSPSTPRGNKERGLSADPGLRLLASDTGRKKVLVITSPPVQGTWLQQLKWMDTVRRGPVQSSHSYHLHFLYRNQALRGDVASPRPRGRCSKDRLQTRVSLTPKPIFPSKPPGFSKVLSPHWASISPFVS